MKEPQKWSIVIFNDEYTPIGIVVYFCITILHMTEPQAIAFSSKINMKGSGKFGEFPKSIAEAKKENMMKRVSDLGYPLRVEIELSESNNLN